MAMNQRYDILIVEDSPDDCFLYEQYLQLDSLYQYTILTKETGKEGLEYCQQSMPDAIVLDYRLPDMTGLEFLEHLHHFYVQQHLPVVMITSNSDLSVVVKVMQAGARDYLTKGGFSHETLQRTIHKVITQTHLLNELAWQQQQQQLVSAIALRIRQSLDLQTVLNTTVQEIRQVLQADRVIVYQFSADQSGTVVAESMQGNWTTSLGEVIEGACFQGNEGKAYVTGYKRAISNIYTENLTDCHLRLLERFQIKASLIIPIVLADRVEKEEERGNSPSTLWGLLIAHQCSEPRVWNEAQLNLLDQIGVQLAIAIQQAELYQKTQTELVERQRTERKLLASEAKWRSLVEDSPDIILLLNQEGKIEFVNRSPRDISSYSPDHRLYSALLPEDQMLRQWRLNRVFQQGKTIRYETRYSHPDQVDTYYHVQLAPIWEEEQVTHAILVATDITERKQAEEALYDSERTLSMLLNNLPGYVYRVSNNQSYTPLYISEGVYAVTGYEQRDYLIDHTIIYSEERHPEDYRWVRQLIQSCTDVQQPYECEYRILTKSGEVRWVWERGQGIYNETGELLYLEGLITDISQRKQDQEQIQFQASMLDQVHNGVIAIDLEGRIIYWNHYAEVMYQWKAAEVLGLPLIDIIMPRKSQYQAEEVAASISEQGYWSGEFDLYRKDGTMFPAYVIDTVLCDSQGNLMGYVGVSIDISDRKQAEAALQELNRELEARVEQRTLQLRQSEAELLSITRLQQAILDGANYAIISTTLDGVIQTFNAGAQAMLGYTPDEMIGKMTPVVFHDAEEIEQQAEILSKELGQPVVPGFDTLVAKARVEGKSEYEWTYLHKEGSRIPTLLSVTALKDRQGTITGFLGIAKDITEQKQAADRLRQTLKELSDFKYALDQAAIVAITDASGKITYANDRFCEISQYSREELVGSTHQLVNSGFHDKDFFAEMWATLSQGQIWQGEIQNRRKDGTPYWVYSTLVPFLDQEGYPIQYLAIRTDITSRKLAEEALRESEIQYRRIVETAGEGMWILDVNNQTTFVNQRLAEMLGTTTEAMTGRTLFDFMDEEGKHIAALNLQRRQQGIAESHDFKFKRQDGSDLWTIIHTTPILDAEGGYIGALAMVTDISARKQAEAIQQQQINRERLVTAITQRIRESLDLSTILNRSVAEVQQVLQADRVLVYRIMPDNSGCAIAEAVDPRWTRIFNQVFPPEVFPPECHTRYSQGMVHVCVDRERDEVMPCLVDFMKSFEVRAKLVVPIVHHQTLWGLLIAHQCSHVRQWQVWEIDLMKQIASQLAIATQQSELYRRLEVELSERKRAQTQLQQSNRRLAIANERLARATRMKDEFLANMSHELRTPLNAILGMSESLLEGIYGTLNPRQERQVTTIERSGKHLLALINDILDLAKIEAGKLELNLAATSIKQLCSSSLAFIRELALKKQIRLTTQIPDSIGESILDELRMRQVLINLLSNAVKFTPEGGNVTLEVRVEEPNAYPEPWNPLDDPSQAFLVFPHVSSTFPSTPNLCFSVIDTGIGIAAKDRGKLFQSFVQVDSRLNRQYSGTGLGLVLVKSIIELHQGTVQVKSELGQGSEFTVRIPYTPVQAQPISLFSVPVGPPETAGHATSPLVLLAEDNPENINTVSDYLESRGYRIILATDGKEAIAQAQAHQPQVILIDIQMPGMDGLEAIRHIRNDGKLSSIPIIALTALAMQGDQERCIQAGANHYMTKPVSLRQLAMTIQTLLGA